MVLSSLCAVHETAGAAVCLPTPGFLFAGPRFVRKSCRSFASKADWYSRSPPRTTVLLRDAPAGFGTAEQRSRRPYSTHKDFIFEVSTADPLNDKQDFDDKELDDMGDAKSMTSNTSSGKRKRSAGPVFYAVRVGRTPGVYYSWSDCEAQTKGMKAECKFFHVERRCVY